MRSSLAVGCLITGLAFAQGCGKHTQEHDVSGSGSSGSDAASEYAPGKVIGTADGRWLTIVNGQVFSGSKDAVWGQLKRGADWQMALAPGLSTDGTFVVVDRALYWIATPSGALVRTALPDGPEPIVVVDPKAKQAGRVVASDGTTAFWRADGQLVSAPLAGGPIKPLVASPGDGPIVVDRVVWVTADGAVRAAPQAGGAPVELAHGLTAPTGIAAAGDAIYVSAGPAIVRVPAGGGPAETIVAKAGAPVAPLVDHGDLLWIDAREHQVYKRPLSP